MFSKKIQKTITITKKDHDDAVTRVQEIVKNGYPRVLQKYYITEVIDKLEVIANYWLQQGNEEKAKKYFSDIKKIQTGEIRVDSPTPLRKYTKSIENNEDSEEVSMLAETNDSGVDS
jgi:hypothetical protein